MTPSRPDAPTDDPRFAGLGQDAALDRAGDDARDPELKPLGDLLDMLPDFFYVSDYDLRFVYANKAAAAYFGLDKQSIVGRLHSEVDHNADQARFYVETCQRIMRDGVPVSTETLGYVAHDGSQAFLEAHIIPFDDPHTGKRMMLGLSRDVTASVRLAGERQRATELARELRVAQEIQRSLAPASSLAQDEIDAAGSSTPAAYAGGDFYDWAPSPEGDKFCVGIGDVSGHGVGSAILAASCRAYARVLASVEPMNDLISTLNAFLADDLRDGHFITFAGVTISTSTWEMRIAAAGHGPIWVRRADGTLIELHAQLPPLGVLDSVESPQAHVLTFEKGDALVLVSDGTFEAMNHEGDQLGLETLRRVVKQVRGTTAAEIRDEIELAVSAHRGVAPISDDATIVVVRRV
jgi:PAS domain S-box-containing protein